MGGGGRRQALEVFWKGVALPNHAEAVREYLLSGAALLPEIRRAEGSESACRLSTGCSRPPGIYRPEKEENNTSQN